MRARSTALVNDDLLIDLGPDLLTSANFARKYLGNLKATLITHRHEDHWLPQNLEWRQPGFTKTSTVPMTVYGPADALSDITAEISNSANFTWKAVTAGDCWTAGDYTITAIPATHGGGYLEPLLYVIERDGRKLFYSTDTAPYGERAWELLRGLGPMALIVLDGTAGKLSGGDGHHGMAQFLETRARMIEEGVLRPGYTRIVAHHFSHNGGFTHDEMVEAYGHHDVGVTYDGMESEV